MGQKRTSLLPPTALVCQRQVNFGPRDNTASASAVSANYSGCFARARHAAASRQRDQRRRRNVLRRGDAGVARRHDQRHPSRDIDQANWANNGPLASLRRAGCMLKRCGSIPRAIMPRRPRRRRGHAEATEDFASCLMARHRHRAPANRRARRRSSCSSRGRKQLKPSGNIAQSIRRAL
jgi:hypothetical protein